MIKFTIIWAENKNICLDMSVNREKDGEFLKKCLSLIPPENITRLLDYGCCSVSNENHVEKQRLWELLRQRLDGFIFPEPIQISVRAGLK